MAKEAIRNTALTTEAANAYFRGRIEGDSFREDVSLLSAARALFDKRLKPGESIRISVYQLFYGEDFSVSPIEEMARTLVDGQLAIYSLSVRKTDSGRWMESTKEVLERSGLYPMEDLMAWLDSKNTKALIYTDQPHVDSNPKSPTNNCKTIVIMENLMMARWRRLGSFLCRFYAKYFQENPCTPEEHNLILRGIGEEDSSAFLSAITQYANTLDLRSGKIRSLLADFETRFEKERMEDLEREIKDYKEQMDELFQRIGDLIERRDEAEVLLFGYRNGDHKSEPVTMNYFLANKNLVLKSVTRDYIDFYASGWLSNWDPEKADATFGHGRCGSWLEYNKSYGVSDEDAKLLWNALFMTETIKVRLWSHYRLSLRGTDPMRIMTDDGTPDITNALPNPHHRYHACGGNNKRYVAQCIMDHDIVGAIEQCISATVGINLTEHASYQYFARDIFDPDFGEIIYIKEKDKFVTTKEAIKWLKGQNGKKTEKKEK